MIFRGYLQRRLLERWSAAWAIGISTVVFGLAHVMPHAIVAAIPLGLWFGMIAWRSDSIGPSILCHAFVNSGLNAWRMGVKFGEIPVVAQWAFIAAVMVVGVISFVICLLPSRWSGTRGEPAGVR